MTALELLAGPAPELALTLWLRGTAIIAAAALLVRLWSRASAATRHGVWMLAFVALAVAPFARPLIPHWTVAARCRVLPYRTRRSVRRRHDRPQATVSTNRRARPPPLRVAVPVARSAMRSYATAFRSGRRVPLPASLS